MKASSAALTPPPGFVQLCTLDDLEEDDVHQVLVDGYPPVAVYLIDTECFVTADTCSHGNASLADGIVADGEIECPFHSGRFDIRTGAATAHPCSVAIAVYPVVTCGDEVFADLNHPKVLGEGSQ